MSLKPSIRGLYFLAHSIIRNFEDMNPKYLDDYLIISKLNLLNLESLWASK